MHVDSLFLVTAGTAFVNSLGPLSNGVTTAFFEKAREAFTFIVIDGCPILPVIDGLLVSQHADTVVLSVRRDTVRRPGRRPARNFRSLDRGNASPCSMAAAKTYVAILRAGDCARVEAAKATVDAGSQADRRKSPRSAGRSIVFCGIGCECRKERRWLPCDGRESVLEEIALDVYRPLPMKILLLNQCFYPDVVSSAQHLTDLAVALAARRRSALWSRVATATIIRPSAFPTARRGGAFPSSAFPASAWASGRGDPAGWISPVPG